MTAVLPPRSSSMWARARMTTRPRPVRYASRMPERPTMIPPVGKSGPLRCFISCSTFASGLSISSRIASTVSPRLCGGMLVAIPTAIPAELLDVGARAHDDAAAAGPVRVADAGAADDDSPGRKVRPLEVLHQLLDVRVGVVDQLQNRVDRLAEIVRRHVGRHPDCDPR